jgi:hypothetical protein
MEIEKVVESLVKRYAIRYPHADRDDLGQTAWEAAACAQRTWKADGGALLTSYVWRAVNTALWREVVYQWSPVHAGTRKLGALLCDTRSVPLEEFHSEAESADRLLDRARAFRRLREAIEARPDGALALTYLLGDEPATAVAKRLGVRVEDIRAVARATCAAVREDETLREVALALR